MSDRDAFAAFVDSSCRDLLRSAWLLVGDWPAAEDLVQSSLVAMWQRWRTSGPVKHPEAYARRVLVTTFLRWSRRRWGGEFATDPLPESAADQDAYARFETYQAVHTAVRVLPPRQRAVVVLRYFAELSEAETAAAMDCAIGTVKSQTAKALATLQRVPGLADVLTEGHTS